MARKTRIIIYIVIALTALILGIIAVLSVPKESTPQTADGFMKLGNKYLIELSYDKAVIEFNKAIEIEPRNADAYIGLAEAYLGMGDENKAIETLELGYENTGDERIREKLEELLGAEAVTGEVISAKEVTTVVHITETFIDDMVEVYIPYEFTGPTYIYDSALAYIDLGNNYYIALYKFEDDITINYYKYPNHKYFGFNNIGRDFLFSITIETYDNDQKIFLTNSVRNSFEAFFPLVKPYLLLYDEAGNLIKRAENEYNLSEQLVHSVLYNSSNEVIDEICYEYDDYGKIVKISHNDGYSEYIYDSDGKLFESTKKYLSGETITKYTYDQNSNYLSAINDYNRCELEYDSNGNTIIKYNHNGSNGFSYSSYSSYDLNGNVLESSADDFYFGYEYDANGNLIKEYFRDSITERTSYYTYDENNRVISSSEYTSGDESKSEYIYDGKGKLITKMTTQTDETRRL